MIDKVRIEKREDYLYLKFIDFVDLQKLKKILEQTYYDLKKNGFSNVLFDFLEYDSKEVPIRKKIVSAMIIFDTYQYNTDINIAVLMEMKEYDVIVKNYKNLDLGEFAIKMFQNEDDAIQWLKKTGKETS